MTASQHRGTLARTEVSDDIEQWQGVFVELWLTFILVQTIWGATNRRRRRVFLPSVPIGCALALDIMTGVSESTQCTQTEVPKTIQGNDASHSDWLVWI